jgi:glycerol-3-phosphate cytidylyltransferase
MKVITFGTFDMFHIGHLNILERARAMGTSLVVGVSSDKLNFSKKSRYPICNEDDRTRIIRALSCVDDVFLEESLELKAEYIKQFNADLLVMGDDWAGRFDHLKSICQVEYLPRTPAISTTQLIEVVQSLPRR